MTAHAWRRTLAAVLAPLLDGPIIIVILLALARTLDWLLRALNGAVAVAMLVFLVWQISRGIAG